MLRKKTSYFVLILTLLFVVSILLQGLSNREDISINPEDGLKKSSMIDETDNILITKLYRRANISGYGLVNMEDQLTLKNLNNNPVYSFMIGIPLEYSDILIFYEAVGSEESTLIVDRPSITLNEYEMFFIHFESPLLPFQSKTVSFLQTYKDMVHYLSLHTTQDLSFTGFVYPILPYIVDGDVRAEYLVPSSSEVQDYLGGTLHPDGYVYYELSDYLEPFLANLEQKTITIHFTDSSLTKLNIIELNREIDVSAWGGLEVTDEILIENKGAMDVTKLSLSLDSQAKGILIFDDLGDILGTTIEEISEENPKKYKRIDIELQKNRIVLTPGNRFYFSIQFYLPYENYFSINWFEESVTIGKEITQYEYIIENQQIQIKIEGSSGLKYLSKDPDSIVISQGTLTLLYLSRNVSPLDDDIILFTYYLDIFGMIFRPLIFILLIISICSIFIVVTKSSKEKLDISDLELTYLPSNEIREFCSLYEDKNALILEIRRAEDEVKRKKLPKKAYKNLLSKNNRKIEEINSEILPFKKVLKESNPDINNIVTSLDNLEAERVSIKDALNLLDSRYRQGKLPSRESYVKLSDEYLKRRKRIDRNIDKNIQQLRSYLL